MFGRNDSRGRHLIEEERVSQVLHVVGDGQLSLQPEVKLVKRPPHLLRQQVHPFTLLRKYFISTNLNQAMFTRVVKCTYCHLGKGQVAVARRLLTSV